MPRKQPETLMEYAIARGGIRKGAKAMTFLISWATAVEDLGHELGGDGGTLSAAMAEYAEYWKLTERSAWRDLSAFRQVFGTAADPAAIVRAARREHAHMSATAALGAPGFALA